MKEWFGTFSEVTVPNMTPAIDEEIYEQALNEDTFWKTPIVSRSLEQALAKEQFNEYTTKTAKFLGEMFGASPA